MLQKPNLSKRLHALDNLRGVMMWLGIVFHVSILHTTYTTAPITLRDTQTSLGADVLVGFIHAFRMPVFFILAGFFVCLLAQQRGLSVMLRHRFKRIALPFAVFWLLLFPVTAVAYLAYLYRMSPGGWGIDLPEANAPNETVSLDAVHMWFLWMLIWFCMLGAAVIKVTQSLKGLSHLHLELPIQALVTQPYAPLVLTLPLLLTDSGYSMGVLETNTSFLPPLAQWLHYSVFFLWGMAMFVHREQALSLFANRRISATLLGLLFFGFYLGLAYTHSQNPQAVPHATGWLAAFYNLGSWWMCLAWMGWFMHLLEREIPFLSYLAQSSYWIYLLHFPLTLVTGAIIYHWQAPTALKILLNVLFTTLVCVVSYQVLVRRTWISVLLNGKKYT
jgi:peptidoglycan/LPS O-acetylase OafA/YrhL